MELLLVHPEIPHNTGCAARLSAALRVRLHLVQPLGFSLQDRYLKRAGLDYWPLVDLVVHSKLESALETLAQESRRPLEERLKLFTARGGTSLFEARFEPDDVLCFGSESSGLPAELLQRPELQRVYLPIAPGVRSLNLANAISVGLYTALVRSGAELPDNDGTYVAHADAQRDVWPQHVAREGG
ncbi:MAG: tRNA (cytidine(34)-2'-O)-methyltransferase [Planctomycetota bacterium]